MNLETRAGKKEIRNFSDDLLLVIRSLCLGKPAGSMCLLHGCVEDLDLTGEMIFDLNVYFII